jgi:hypothetical protein
VTSDSLATNLNRGLGFDDVAPGTGPAEILTLGATVSTVNEREAGTLTLPAASTALAQKPWPPFGSAVLGVKGERQGNQAPPAFRRHWKVEPTWSEVNLNVGVGSWMSAPWLGPEAMLAFGACFVAENLVNAE